MTAQSILFLICVAVAVKIVASVLRAAFKKPPRPPDLNPYQLDSGAVHKPGPRFVRHKDFAPAAVSIPDGQPKQFEIGYGQILHCTAEGLSIPVKEMTIGYRGEAKRLYGETVSIHWDNISSIAVHAYRDTGDSGYDPAEYRFYLKDGERKLPKVRSYAELREIAADNKLNKFLLSKMEKYIPEPELEEAGIIPFCIERSEDTTGQAAFLDYCRSVGQVAVRIFCNIRD